MTLHGTSLVHQDGTSIDGSDGQIKDTFECAFQHNDNILM